MNALLSLILSFAMLFSGGALPETADVASTLAVQDFVLEYDGESYPLGFDVAVTAAAAQDGLTLHFEAVNGDGEVLMPVSGKVSQDGVTFSISEGGKVYTLSAETLQEMLGMDEVDAEAFEAMTRSITDYSTMLGEIEKMQSATVSPETQAEVMEILYANMDNVITEEITWDFGTGELPATHVNGTLNIMDVYAAMDGWMAMDDETVSPMLRYMLDMYNELFAMNYATIAELETEVEIAESDAASVGIIGGADGPTAVYVAGENPEYSGSAIGVICRPKGEDSAAENCYVPAESYTQLIENMIGGDEEALEMLSAMTMDMDVISAQDGDTLHQLVSLYMILSEEEGIAMNINAESAASPESTIAYFNMYMEMPESSIGFEVQMGVEGSVANPDAVDLVMLITASDAVHYTQTDAEEHDCTEYNTTNVLVTASSTYENGLEDSEVIVEVNESSVNYIDGEFENEYEGDVISFSANVDEETDEAGNLLSFFEFEVDVTEEETIGLNFNTVLSKAPVVDYFAGRESVELTADTEDAGYQSLSADAMGLMSDAMAIAANEDFMALTGLITGTTAYEEEIEVGIEDYSSETIYCETIEEVAEIYAGNIPAYTAPEGYSLQATSAESDGSYMEAIYSDANGSMFTMSLYAYGEANSDPAFLLQDGVLTEMSAPVVTLSGYDGVYFAANVQLPDGILVFYFDEDLTVDQIPAYLAGLEL